MELKDLVQEVLGEISRTENSIEKKQEEEEKFKEIQSIFEEDEKKEEVQEEKTVEKEESKENFEVKEVEDSEDSSVEVVPQEDEKFNELVQSIEEIDSSGSVSDEENFLSDLKERLLVIFEGFQSPNNQNVEAKLDLTLNFLEYLLAKVEDRLEEIESHK